MLQVVPAAALLAGTYNGLFYQTNLDGQLVLNSASMGMLGNCVIETNSMYSADLKIGGANLAFSGVLNSAGVASKLVKGSGRNPPKYQVNLQLQSGVAAGQISGSVSNASGGAHWVAALYAAKATNALPVPAGTFSLVIPADTNSPNSPSGASQLQWSNSPSGQVTMGGSMADGAAISEAAPVAADGTIPLWQSLYGGTGAVVGWLSLSNGRAQGVVAWIRPGGVILPPNYPGGFTNVVEAQP